MITYNFVNMPEFQRELRNLYPLSKKSGREFLKQEAKLFVRDVTKLTPAMGGNGDGPTVQSFNDQRRIGRQAVANDINRIFHPANKATQIVDNIRNAKTRNDLRQYMVRGQYDKLKTAFRRMNIHFVDTATAEMHRQSRNSRGRTVGGKHFLVLEEKSIPKLITLKQKMVGLAKSGWVKAARSLGLQLPKWISDKAGTGVYLENFSATRDTILVGNTVGFIQSTGARLGIIERALKLRAQSMRHRYEKILNKAFSGYKGGKYGRK